ncbi:hypothetical protein JZ751_019731 [Albula glossodonta]|uniref:Immunoglobulin V-set domain-containing protein n=1 Tax=Albula glossodonta TaxID=121402 RepID=A0A8T2N011_9TELE|nr:hypothetical protein JZ751_019731 [Albula glossodonta]
MLLCLFLLFSTVRLGFSAGDEVTQQEEPMSKAEGQEVSLECSFNTDRSYPDLYWYRQYPGSTLQYILYNGNQKHRAEFAKGRFDSALDKSKGKIILTISQLIPEDSFTAGDNVSQEEKLKSGSEGEQVSLECSFQTGSSEYYLYWYRQYPGSAPQYILRRGYSGHTAEFAKGRFDATVSDKSFQDETESKADVVNGFEGSNVSLSHRLTDSDPYSLHWYRQYPRSKPEFIILLMRNSAPVKTDGRFTAKHDKQSKRFSSAAEVRQEAESVTKTEGQEVTLNCSYIINTNAVLYWYRQYPGPVGMELMGKTAITPLRKEQIQQH